MRHAEHVGDGNHVGDDEHPGGVAHAAVFEEHRSALLNAAYRILGTIHDSEDAVQNTWLRWQNTSLQEIRDPRSYLLRAVTRSALNVIRSRQRRREDYLGPWLPEPVSTDAESEPGREAEIADEVSLAMLVILESLSPLERAAFVLREVFAMPYWEVSRSLDRSESATRQLVSRARAHVRETAPRNPVDPATHRRLTEDLLAVSRGVKSMDEFIPLLSPDVVLTTDAGGHAKAALNRIRGIHKVLRFSRGVLDTPDVAGLTWHLGEVNGRSAVIGARSGEVDTVTWIEADGGLVTRIDMIRNPEKLAAVRIAIPREKS